MEYIKNFNNFKLNENWYHGTPDNRSIENNNGFSINMTSIEYVKDPELFEKINMEMSDAKKSGNDKLYFEILNIIPNYKDTFTYKKPLFLTDTYSVAKTYADPQRAFDYQNSIEKVYEVDVDCNKIVRINAYGDRFRFIDINKVKRGFIDAGISEDEIDKVIKMFNFYVSNTNGIKTDTIAAIGNWFGFDCIDVVGVLDSYHGGTIKSTVRMVLDPSKVKIINSLKESKYWTKSKILEYKKVIKYFYELYFKETDSKYKPIYKICTVGSFGTDKFIENKSDIDFMINILSEMDKYEVIDIINFINDKLIEKYGEIENKGGKVEVIGINDKFWFDY